MVCVLELTADWSANREAPVCGTRGLGDGNEAWWQSSINARLLAGGACELWCELEREGAAG